MVSQNNVWYLDDGNFLNDYQTVLEDFKRIIASADQYVLLLEETKYYLIFLGNCTESSKKRIKALFDETFPGIEVEDRENLEIVGSPKEANALQVLLNKNLIDLQRLSEVVTKLYAHYGFYLLKNCFSPPNLLYFLRTSPCFEEMDLLQHCDSISCNSLSKICNVNFIERLHSGDSPSLQRRNRRCICFPDSSASCFLASSTGAKCALSCILPEDYVNASFEKA